MEDKHPTYPMRINKYLALKGFSTRKDADLLIEKGAVTVNGRRAVLGERVSEPDVVKVQQPSKTYQYFAFNKPAGVITHSPQLGEKDAVTSAGLSGMFPVGRLDKASRGLIILTNDARITDRLLNPKYVHDKEYRVTTKTKLPSYFKNRMEGGVDIEGYKTKKCEVRISSDYSFSITLTEGKKHQIRRMCAALAVDIENLERVRIMNIKLAGLKPNQHRLLKGLELSEFLKSLELVSLGKK